MQLFKVAFRGLLLERNEENKKIHPNVLMISCYCNYKYLLGTPKNIHLTNIASVALCIILSICWISSMLILSMKLKILVYYLDLHILQVSSIPDIQKIYIGISILLCLRNVVNCYKFVRHHLIITYITFLWYLLVYLFHSEY